MIDASIQFIKIYNVGIHVGEKSVYNMRRCSLGLGDQFEMVKEKYREANMLLGDIVKVFLQLLIIFQSIKIPDKIR